MGITVVRQTKNASELVDGEVSDIANFEFWGL